METTMTHMIKGRGDLAEVLTAMPFGVLMQVAQELVSMVTDANEDAKLEGSKIARDLGDPTGMAQMLYDWAEAQQESD